MQSILENPKETTGVTIMKFAIFFLAHSNSGKTYRCTVPVSTSVLCSNNSQCGASVAIVVELYTSFGCTQVGQLQT